MTSSPFFDNVCTLPLPTDIFAQALHPTEPQILIGLASGHVYAYSVPSQQEDSVSPPPAISIAQSSISKPGILSQRRRSSTASLNGLGSIEVLWKTRRHKGSCRTLCYSNDGKCCYSAGTDGLLKAFDSQNGVVTSKIALPLDRSGKIDAATLLHALSPQTLLAATDSGALHVINLTDDGSKIGQITATHKPHGQEHVADLAAIPPSQESTSGFSKQWITVGGSTLCVMDLYKGVVATSEDQEEELLSVTFVEGLKKGGTSVGEKVLVGQADGVVSLWERGVWGDLDERIIVDRDGSPIERLCVVPSNFVPRGKLKANERVVAAGTEDGSIQFLRVGRNVVLHEWQLKHEQMDGVIGIEFDATERLVSSSGHAVKVWTPVRAQSSQEASQLLGKHEREDSDVNEEEGDDSDHDSSEEDIGAFQQSSDEDSDEQDKQQKGKRKKRKRNKGKDKSGGQALSFSGLM